MPDFAKRGVLTFVLQELHAIETNGKFSIAWSYENHDEKDKLGIPPDTGDLPGDLITFKGEVRIGFD